MLRNLLVLICFAYSTSAYASNSYAIKGIIVKDDTSSFLFEYDMRYVGSLVNIDVNYRYVLGYLIELLEKNPTWTVHVRGHVCCGPSYRTSKKRAKKAYTFLIRSGISKDRVTYKGYSDSIPIVFPEKTEEDAAQNRRVDFVIRKK